jgi:hypothetical protein
MPKAEGLLGQILDLFTDAEKVSGKFKSRVGTGDSSLMVLDMQTDLDAAHQTLHEKMRGLSIRRQNKTTLRQKAKWALYEKKHFERLITDVIELVNALVETFPAVQQAQRELCKIEVADIGINGSLPILEDIVASQDKDLHAAIMEVLKKSDVSMQSQSVFEISLFLRAAQRTPGTIITAKSCIRVEHRMSTVTSIFSFKCATVLEK